MSSYGCAGASRRAISTDASMAGAEDAERAEQPLGRKRRRKAGVHGQQHEAGNKLGKRKHAPAKRSVQSCAQAPACLDELPLMTSLMRTRSLRSSASPIAIRSASTSAGIPICLVLSLISGLGVRACGCVHRLSGGTRARFREVVRVGGVALLTDFVAAGMRAAGLAWGSTIERFDSEPVNRRPGVPSGRTPRETTGAAPATPPIEEDTAIQSRARSHAAGRGRRRLLALICLLIAEQKRCDRLPDAPTARPGQSRRRRVSRHSLGHGCIARKRLLASLAVRIASRGT